MSTIAGRLVSKTAKLLMNSTVITATSAVALNALLVTPSYAAFTETNFGDTQVVLAADAVCGEQLDDTIFGLQTAEIAADFIGLGIEAAGAVFIVSEIPGIVAQAAALALGTAAFALEQQAGDMPSCEGDFLGSVSAGGGISAGGDSEIGGALEVTGVINANGGINVAGVLNANNGLNVQNGATFSGNVLFNNQITVTQQIIGNGGMTITGATTLNGNTQINGDLNVTGAGSFGSLAVASGLSVHNGAMWIGNKDGTTYQPGISIGGGALAGVGTLGSTSNASHTDAIAIGNGSSSSNLGSIAFGLTAQATAQHAIAIGSQAGSVSGGANSVALGRLSNAGGISASAVGHNASAGGLDSVAFGTGASSSSTGATSVGARSVASGTASVAVGESARATQSGAVAVGSGSSATGVNAIALGRGATATGSIAVGAFAGASNGGAAFGDGAQATGTNSAALGTNANATHANAIAIGSNSVTSEDNTVSFGDVGAERRLMNVDDGILNYDAVNMGQLRRAVAKLNRGVASTIALSAPLMDLERGETSLALGGGFYQGENGVAVRGAYRLDTQTPLMVSGSVATAGNDSITGQVGVAVKF